MFSFWELGEIFFFFFNLSKWGPQITSLEKSKGYGERNSKPQHTRKTMSGHWVCVTLWSKFNKHCHIWSCWKLCRSEQWASGLLMAFPVYPMCVACKCQQELGWEVRGSVACRSGLENRKCCQEGFLWSLWKSLVILMSVSPLRLEKVSITHDIIKHE